MSKKTTSTRTVKISDRVAKRIKIGAAIMDTTQEEFVERAVKQLFEAASIQREIDKYALPEHKKGKRRKRR